MLKRKNISSLHVPHNKHTAACVPERLPVPSEVILPMNMHSGHDAEPIVKVGDYVRVGQLIAREEGRFSSPVHATVSGTVAEISPIPTAKGGTTLAIRIESDGKMEKDPDLKPPVVNGTQEFLQALRESGLVGLGGAAFPTWAKFNEMCSGQYTVDTVLVNAAECEPYITSDHRMMVDHTDLIVKGVEYLRNNMMEYLKDATFLICVEKNKPDAIAKLRAALADKPYAKVHELEAIYPQGAKQVTLYNATGRVAIAGKRFPAFHAVIINVSSFAKMAEYMETGMPLVERIVTVDGPGVKTPKNFIAPIGTRISYLLDHVELKGEPGKVVIGGPMNGNAVVSVDSPIVKVSNAVLVFDEKHAVLPDATNCIHCGKCVEKCPINITAWAVYGALQTKDEEEKEKKLIATGVRQCVDCGCCSYICPAHRPLLGWNQEAKGWLKKYAAAKKEKEEGKKG